MLAAPLVVIAAGGLAACGSAEGTIVMGATTTTQCPPLLGITPPCPTTTVDASSTSLGVSTTSLGPVLGLPTATSEPPTTEAPTTEPTVVPEATLVQTK